MKNKLSIKLNAIYFTMYGAFACYFPFLTIYLQSRNLNYTQIGFIFAINSLIAVIAQPIWGYITDKYMNKKKTIILTMLISSIVILSLTVIRDFHVIAACLALFICFQSSIGPIADAFTYDIIEGNKNIQYGQVRLMGSLGFAITALVVGTFISAAQVDKSFYIYSLLLLISMLIVSSIKFKGKHGNRQFSSKDIFEILRNKNFIIFIISVILVNIATGANGSYISVLIQSTNGDVSRIGLLWFTMAMSELPAFFFGNRIIKKYGILNIYLISLGLYAVRFFLDSIAQNYTTVIAIQIMQGITFPLYMMTSLQYLMDIIPPRMRTSAITLYSALGGGLGGFIGNICGGMILESINVFFLFKILSLMCLLSLGSGIILKKECSYTDS